eukprot:UN05822
MIKREWTITDLKDDFESPSIEKPAGRHIAFSPELRSTYRPDWLCPKAVTNSFGFNILTMGFSGIFSGLSVKKGIDWTCTLPSFNTPQYRNKADNKLLVDQLIEEIFYILSFPAKVGIYRK